MAKKSAGFKFKYDSDWYSIQAGEARMSSGNASSIAAMRREYARMRDVAQKRLARLEKAYPNVAAVREHPRGFMKTTDLKPADMATALSDLERFLRAKGSTVSGQRSIERKTIETFQRQGLGLTPKNYNIAIEIFEEMRKQKIVYGSDKVVELAESMLELDDQQRGNWLDHLSELLPKASDITEIPELCGMDADEVLKRLES